MYRIGEIFSKTDNGIAQFSEQYEVPTRSSMGAILLPPSQQIYLAHMTICELFTRFVTLRRYNRKYSDLEASHVIPGLIHKCFLAKSSAFSRSPVSLLMICLQRTTLPS